MAHRWPESSTAASSTAGLVFTFRPRLHLDGSCESPITYIDGDEAVRYRGYPTSSSRNTSNFFEVVPAATATAERGQYKRSIATSPIHDWHAFFRPCRRVFGARGTDGDHVGKCRWRGLSLPRHQRSLQRTSRAIARSPRCDDAARAFKYSIGHLSVPAQRTGLFSTFLRHCFACGGD